MPAGPLPSAAPAPLDYTRGRGLATVMLSLLQQNAFLHRAIVQRGKLEFLLQAKRTDNGQLRAEDVGWIFDQLVATCPPPLSAYPDGTIIDDRGFAVRPTADDLAAAERILADLRNAPPRLFLG